MTNDEYTLEDMIAKLENILSGGMGIINENRALYCLSKEVESLKQKAKGEVENVSST